MFILIEFNFFQHGVKGVCAPDNDPSLLRFGEGYGKKDITCR